MHQSGNIGVVVSGRSGDSLGRCGNLRFNVTCDLAGHFLFHRDRLMSGNSGLFRRRRHGLGC